MRNNKNPIICGASKQCNVKVCFHKTPHQFSEACLGLCPNAGYPDCIEFKTKEKNSDS